jgi:ketosteroid isomerase-like protein
MAPHPAEVVERLARATSAHDLEGIVACFADGYVNQTPTHPQRSFAGRDQVRRNWEQILTGVPDITARVLASTVDGDTGLVGVADERHSTRRSTTPDVRRDHLRGGWRARAGGQVLPGAARARVRHGGRRGTSGADYPPRTWVDAVILVAGGTGLLGSRVVKTLTDAGEQVRVVTRDPRRASHLPAGVEVVVGDVCRGLLDTAVEGCDRVVSAVHGFGGLGGRARPRWTVTAIES